MDFVTVERGDALRERLETFIREQYAQRFGASVTSFAPLLVAATDHGQIHCAAGLRFAPDGFFSEVYLDTPAELSIGLGTDSVVPRQSIFEVTSLCSVSPRTSVSFVRHLAWYGWAEGFAWSIFVATRQLRALLDKLAFCPVTLAEASAERIAEPQAWGRYYDTDPLVLAVNRTSILEAQLKRCTAASAIRTGMAELLEERIR
jgi:Thermostable hemolysin